MRIGALSLLLATLLAAAASTPASAQQAGQTLTWSGVHEGRALTVVLVTRGHTVSDEVQGTQPWWRWGNTTDDTYFFIFTADRLVDLVVEFSTEGGRPKAALYAPTTQEQRLGIEIGQGSYAIPDILPPTVIVWPREGEWLVDGAINTQIDTLTRDLTSGQLTWKTSVGGAPGRPKWTTSTRIYDPAPADGYPRFGLSVLEDESVSYGLVEPFMPSWPYLSIGAADDFGHYDLRLRPLLYDPFSRVITMKWIGFHTAGMYQINSLAYPPNVDFEAPFAFYRFDPSHELYPNMVVRSDIWPAEGPFGPPIRFAQRTAMRMTWTGKDQGLWRYSLTVAGPHAQEETVTVGGLTVRAIPYRRLPQWVVERPWPAATFVEAVSGETGSEGIYDYSMEDNWAVHYWLNGLQDAPPDNYSAPYLDYANVDPRRLREGMRGEYSLNYDRQPRIYLSPIDGRPHLMYAQEGVWNLNLRQILRTYNLDGGPSIDAWVRERLPRVVGEDQWPRAADGVIEEGLYALGGLLLYGGPQAVELRRPDAVPPDRELPIPTDAASWRASLDALAPAEAGRGDPYDLGSWLAPLPGPSLRLEGARIQDVRPIAGGLRFVLILGPEYSIERRSLLDVAGFELPGLERLAPGRYVVSYDGQLRVEPLTPPRISARVDAGLLARFEPGIVHVTLHNEGLQDLREATLELHLDPGRGSQPQLITRTLTLLAGEPLTVELPWTPPLSGDWRLTTRVRPPPAVLAASVPLDVFVADAPATDPSAVWAVSLAPSVVLPAAVAAIALALAASLTSWRSWGKR